MAGGRPEEPAAVAAMVRAAIPRLAGGWVPLSSLDRGDGTFEPGRIDKLCGPDGFATILSPAEPYTFDFTRKNRDKSLTTRFVYLTGTRFQKQTSEARAARWLGLDQADPIYDKMRGAIMAGLTGEVDIYHPSPRILIFAAQGVVEIYGKCD